MIEAETVGNLVQKMIISLCGEQKPGKYYCLFLYLGDIPSNQH